MSSNVVSDELRVTVDGGRDEVLSLQRWLSGNDDFAGRSRLLPSEPAPGRALRDQTADEPRLEAGPRGEGRAASA